MKPNQGFAAMLVAIGLISLVLGCIFYMAETDALDAYDPDEDRLPGAPANDDESKPSKKTVSGLGLRPCARGVTSANCWPSSQHVLSICRLLLSGKKY
jgi:hypothetical protein